MRNARERFSLTAAGFLIGAAVFPSAQASYVERFEPDDDTPDEALHGTLRTGEDGVWSSHMAGGFYVLENRDDPAAVRYFYVLPEADTWEHPGDTVRVDVGGMFPGGEYHSGAGLLVGFDVARRHYQAFVLEDGGGYAVYQRDERGFNAVRSGTSPAIRSSGRNRIEARVSGESLRLSINGTEVATVPLNAGHGTGVGLIVLGAGRFEFDDFELPDAVTADAARAAGPRLDARPAHAQYAGSYDGRGVHVELRLVDGRYEGTLALGAERCDLSAHYADSAGAPPGVQPLVGDATCGADRFRFEARLVDGERLELDVEGIAYRLVRRPTGSTTAPPANVSPVPAAPAARSSAEAAPPDYRALAHDGRSGTLLVKRGRADTGVDSTALARAALAELARHFDAPPQLQDALGDRGGNETQVLFSASRHGAAVQGLVMAVRVGGEALTALAYDAPDALEASLPAMVRSLAVELPQPAAEAAPVPPLQTLLLPEGSGSIGVPPGWQVVSAVKEMVDMAGPDGSLVSLGVHGEVLTPTGAAHMQQSHGALGAAALGGVFVIPYTDPVTAFQSYWEQAARVAAQATGRPPRPQRVTRVIGHAPRPWYGGNAELIDAEWVLEDATPIRYRCLALFGVQPIHEEAWTAYVSIVSAPADRFAQNLPTLMAIWDSWQVSARVHKERLDSAMRDLADVRRIVEEVHARREASLDAIHADWTEYIRGTTTVVDRALDERREVPLYDVDRIVDGLNEAAGYDRYVHVPLRDLE